jgi:hypothetical protein
MTRRLSLKINRNPTNRVDAPAEVASSSVVFTDQYIFHHVVW